MQEESEKSENEGQLRIPALTAGTEETPETQSVSSTTEQPTGHGMSKTQTTLLVFALCVSKIPYIAKPYTDI